MALHRVRSRAHGFESIVSDEWLEAFPDDFDVIDNEPIDRVPASSRRPDTESLPRIAPDDDYR
jgi:hypothetical protein